MIKPPVGGGVGASGLRPWVAPLNSLITIVQQYEQVSVRIITATIIVMIIHIVSSCTMIMMMMMMNINRCYCY